MTLGVTITQVPTSIAVAPSPIAMGSGRSRQLAPSLRDAVGAPMPGGGFTYESSDESIATVSPLGLVRSTGPLGSADTGPARVEGQYFLLHANGDVMPATLRFTFDDGSVAILKVISGSMEFTPSDEAIVRLVLEHPETLLPIPLEDRPSYSVRGGRVFLRYPERQDFPAYTDTGFVTGPRIRVNMLFGLDADGDRLFGSMVYER